MYILPIYFSFSPLPVGYAWCPYRPTSKKLHFYSTFRFFAMLYHFRNKFFIIPTVPIETQKLYA
uniref:Uncharacterized protein n=1 Tax=Anguilla anguilla TaxID=7936 RepID=A0A0E9WTM0_ANGAN